MTTVPVSGLDDVAAFWHEGIEQRGPEFVVRLVDVDLTHLVIQKLLGNLSRVNLTPRWCSIRFAFCASSQVLTESSRAQSDTGSARLVDEGHVRSLLRLVREGTSHWDRMAEVERGDHMARS
jgi:hypothetical protein